MGNSLPAIEIRRPVGNSLVAISVVISIRNIRSINDIIIMNSIFCIISIIISLVLLIALLLPAGVALRPRKGIKPRYNPVNDNPVVAPLIRDLVTTPLWPRYIPVITLL